MPLEMGGGACEVHIEKIAGSFFSNSTGGHMPKLKKPSKKFSPCKGCPTPAKCRKAGKCLKGGRGAKAPY
jgi:hypothetical protein